MSVTLFKGVVSFGFIPLSGSLGRSHRCQRNGWIWRDFEFVLGFCGNNTHKQPDDYSGGRKFHVLRSQWKL